MSRHGERYAARHWIEGSGGPQPSYERWNNPGPTPHEAIARRLKANYDDAHETLPERLQELLAELNRLTAGTKSES